MTKDQDHKEDNQERQQEREVFVISVAAEITGMHAQTLRTYDRIGLVTPERTRGAGAVTRARTLINSAKSSAYPTRKA